MPPIRSILAVATCLLLSGCNVAPLAFTLIPAVSALIVDMSVDQSFQRIQALSWDGTKQDLYMAFSNQDGPALYRWNAVDGLKRVRALAPAPVSVDIRRDQLLLKAADGVLVANGLQAPWRWVPMPQSSNAGNAFWDDDRITVTATNRAACTALAGVWRGDATWSRPERLYGEDLPWNAQRSPSGRRLAYSYLANSSDTTGQIRVHDADGTRKSFDPQIADRQWSWLNEATLVFWHQDARPLAGGLVTLDVDSGQKGYLDPAPIFEPSFGVVAVKSSGSGTTVAWLIERLPPDFHPRNSNRIDQRLVLTDGNGRNAKQILSLSDFPPGSRFPAPLDRSVTVYLPTTAPAQEDRR